MNKHIGSTMASLFEELGEPLKQKVYYVKQGGFYVTECSTHWTTDRVAAHTFDTYEDADRCVRELRQFGGFGKSARVVFVRKTIKG